jgi:hypothetical protein
MAGKILKLNKNIDRRLRAPRNLAVKKNAAARPIRRSTPAAGKDAARKFSPIYAAPADFANNIRRDSRIAANAAGARERPARRSVAPSLCDVPACAMALRESPSAA